MSFWRSVRLCPERRTQRLHHPAAEPGGVAAGSAHGSRNVDGIAVRRGGRLLGFRHLGLNAIAVSGSHGIDHVDGLRRRHRHFVRRDCHCLAARIGEKNPALASEAAGQIVLLGVTLATLPDTVLGTFALNSFDS